MKNGILTRLLVAKILKKIRESSLNFDDCLEKYSKEFKLLKKDKKMIHSICFSTMRNIQFINIVIKKLVKKINNNDIGFFLLISAIAQIYYLDYKPYAVINSTCESLKKTKTKYSTEFINAVLRNAERKKENILISKINNLNYPSWFKKNIAELPSNKRKSIYKSILNKPPIHLQFKNNKDIKLINKKYILTSKNSIVLKEKVNLFELPGYKNGNWWVQDYAASLPVKFMGNVKNKKVLDMCSAPGGKTFQLINLGASVTSFDISKKRIDIMKSNAKRLNYRINLINDDIMNFNPIYKFDIVLIDAPCSSTGTIKRNPEILFRKEMPDLKKLENIQYRLLIKASDLLKKNGILIYAVCSIFKKEGIKQIERFLIENKNFEIDKLDTNKTMNLKKLIENGVFQSYPYNLKNIGGVDGFFIARLIKKY
tara:strand:+ start:193 stop:1470 length:1278 start_codon:yes stop_codon:yes gene_type:complete